MLRTVVSPAPSGIRVARVAAFLAIAFGFSWIQWLAVIASSKHWVPFAVPLTPLGAFGPGVTALLVLRGKEERREWWRALVRWRVGASVYAVAIALLPLVAAACFYASEAIVHRTTQLALPRGVMILAITVEILILGGPLGEEPGWRGFLLPELRRSLSPLLASLAVGVIWFLWHLPLFWIPGSGQSDIPMYKFAASLIAYSFIITWLFERGRNSTFAAMLFHTSANVTFTLAAIAIADSDVSRLFWRIYLSALVGLALVVAASPRFRKGAAGEAP